MKWIFIVRSFAFDIFFVVAVLFILPVELRSPNNFQYLYGAHKSVSGILRTHLFTMQTRRPKTPKTKPKIDIHANRMVNDGAAGRTVSTFDMKICTMEQKERNRESGEAQRTACKLLFIDIYSNERCNKCDIRSRMSIVSEAWVGSRGAHNNSAQAIGQKP